MTSRVGLIGYPVEHSISPTMQQSAFDELGISARYELWPTPPESVEERVNSLRQPAFLGANVTVPHKMAVMDYLDNISQLARQAGAVNTILNLHGSLQGENTDIPGLARAIELTGLQRENRREAVILGAGGAARAAILALAGLGFGKIWIHNRTTERAEHLASDLAGYGAAALLGESSLHETLKRANLLLNSTAVGWQGDALPLPADALEEVSSTCLAVDLTYRQTPFLIACESLGLPTLDGLPMLVFQGAKSFEIWTNREAPVDTMMAAALAARS